MRFWDASALVPLVIEEPSTEQMRQWLVEDTDVLVWVWTPVEMVGAVERLHREDRISRASRRDALGRIDDMAARWDEVSDVLSVRRLAVRLLARHPLRAADSAQLGAAMLAVDVSVSGMHFVTRDDRLGQAAESEGFTVLGPA